MKTRVSPVAGLLIMAVVLAACGGTAASGAIPAPTPKLTLASSAAPQQTATSSSAAIDACALITEKEATALLGTDPGPGVNSGTDTEPACAYDASLTIGVTLADAKAQFDLMRPAPGSPNLQTISGVGDDAYATIVANTIAAMEILKGSVSVSINIQGNPSAQTITVAALTTLGTTVAGRLSGGG